jgi:nicotinate-nucleotide--dimethylbenzimidazole phosphoribosyltransferase
MPTPFDDMRALLAACPDADETARAKVVQRQASLAKPLGSLGRLEEAVAHLAAWQGKERPVMMRPMICVFAANHGVVAQGVSAFPADVTGLMLKAYGAGGGTINQICAAYEFGFKAFELALDLPTEDFTQAPALDEKSCVATMAFGMEALAGGVDVLGLGEMGIGNTTAAAAIYAALYGGDPDRFVGLGAGADEAQLARKKQAVRQGLARHAQSLHDPLHILAAFGGREIAAMAGAILAARLQKVPVVLDGYVVTAAAAVLHAMEPDSISHCIAGHCSAEGAHRDVLARLGLVPLLDLGMRLGEGTGAAFAMALLKGALASFNNTFTLQQAGIVPAASGLH